MSSVSFNVIASALREAAPPETQQPGHYVHGMLRSLESGGRRNDAMGEQAVRQMVAHWNEGITGISRNAIAEKLRDNGVAIVLTP